jgi:hypothetical protein
MADSWDDPGPPPPGGEAAEAAAALQHDLGKAVRLSAPGEPESDAEALRDRLAADLLRTRTLPDGVHSAAEVFDAWRERWAAALTGRKDLEARLAGIAREVETLRPRLAEIPSMPEAELREIDDATRRIAAECRALKSEATS